MLDTDILDQDQEAAIMGVVRSAIVCLHSLLKIKQQGGCEPVLKDLLVDLSGNTRDLVISDPITIQDRFIVENLSAILFDDHFENFRNDLIAKLVENNTNDQAMFFKERLEIARSLPVSSKGIVNNVVSLLKNNKEKFLDWLFLKFLDLEHDTTQSALVDLTFNYLPNIYHSNEYSSYTDGIYFSTNLQQQIHTPLYRNLLLEFEQQGLSIDERDEIIKLFQMMRKGILVNNDHNYIWKLNPDLEFNTLELFELRQILRIAANYATGDLSERMSLLLDLCEDPVVIKFKQLKLSKVRVEQFKHRIS